MKVAIPVLSAEQRRAQQKYKLAIVPALFLAVFGVAIVTLVITIICRRFLSMSGSLVSGLFNLVPFALAHLWAVREVRRAGLSLESKKVEVVARKNTNFSGEARHWWYPKTFLGSISNASGPILMCAASWLLWHWPWSPFSPVEKWLGIFGFWLFLWAGIIGIIFIRSPHVRIDEDGIVAFPHPMWRKRVHWKDIARCEISTLTDFMGRGPMRFFYLRDVRGRVLLRLSPASLSGLSREEQAEIDCEIRKRLGIAAADEAGAKPD